MRPLMCSVLAFLLVACNQQNPTPIPAADAIDSEATRLMAREDVKGMALAVIVAGEIAYVTSYGHRNVEQDLPLETNTIMYGASFTKTAFAYMILQLVDEERFELDKPLAEYLSQPLPDYEFYADLSADDRWRQITARHVLTHSPGFANFRWLEDDETLRFHFNPGERYAYSGEGFYLLQFVLEDGLDLDVGAEMQTRIFDRFGMTNTSMQWRPDFADNLADGYGIDGSFEPHDERDNVSAAGSMDTTIEGQAKMWSGILRGDGLSAESRAELVKSQLDIRSAHQFPTLIDSSDARAEEIGLAAGLGLVTFGEGDGKGWFKGGHNPWTGNIAVCQETRQRCVILLANSVRAEIIYPEIVDFILGDSGMPWWWEYQYE